MKSHLLIPLFLILSFAGYSQKHKNTTSSLWIVADSAADLKEIDYRLYRGNALISTIKTDSLVQYHAKPQRYELSLLTNEYTMVIGKLADKPIVITNMTFNKNKITWVVIDRLLNEIQKRPTEKNQDVFIVDYEMLKLPIYRDR